MFLESHDTINQPLEVVYNLVKNDLPKIVPYLPNVKKIDVIQFSEKGPTQTEIVNHWYAKVDIPPMAQKFVREELFSWKDMAVWHNDKFYVEYELESFWANDLYTAKGKNFFTAVGTDKMELKVTCDVTIHADKVPGVPKFLVSKVLPVIEDMLKKVMQPNLAGLGKGLTQYFQQQK